LRGFLRRGHPSEIKNYLAGRLHYISDRVEIISYDHGELLDFHESMWWKISYRVPGFVMHVDNGYEFKSPMMQLSGYALFGQATYDWPEKRNDDLFFYTTILLDGNETIKLPKGFKISKPTNSKEIDETYAYYKGEAEMSKKGLLVTQKAKIKRRQVPPDGYAGFRKAMTEAKKYTKTIFRAEKGSAK